MSKDLELGKRIAWLRTNRGLEQTQIAAEMGFVYGTYQKYEYGYAPSRRNIDTILRYYKCSRAWLLTGEGVPYPDRPQEKPEGSHANCNNIHYINPATRILDEAIAEAGVDLNDAQKTALMKIIQEEIDNAAIKAGNKAKEIIRVFKKED